MREQAITLTMLKQRVFALPANRLQEAYDFLDFLIIKTPPEHAKRIKKLEGIWEGLGFERIGDVEQEIRAIRHDAEQSILNRINKCNT